MQDKSKEESTPTGLRLNNPKFGKKTIRFPELEKEKEAKKVVKLKDGTPGAGIVETKTTLETKEKENATASKDTKKAGSK